MNTITITAGDYTVEAELNDSSTAQAIWNALPISATANLWGDEIYFEIPVRMAQAPNARVDVEVGDLGYWPVGSAFCIFFGPTPVSRGERPRAASPVNPIGRILGDTDPLHNVEYGAEVVLSRVRRGV